MDILARLEKISYEEKCVLIFFILLVFSWVFRPGIKINDFYVPGWSDLFADKTFISDGTTAIFFAVLLFLVPSKKAKGQHVNGLENSK